MMERRGKLNSTTLALDIIGFTVVIGGAFLARYATEEPIAIVAGILASIGIGLLALSRYFR